MQTNTLIEYLKAENEQYRIQIEILHLRIIELERLVAQKSLIKELPQKKPIKIDIQSLFTKNIG